jgi:hypothetical protein
MGLPGNFSESTDMPGNLKTNPGKRKHIPREQTMNNASNLLTEGPQKIKQN